MSKGFNLADALKNVSNLDTVQDGAPQIEMIDINLIDSDERNFYELRDLDGLASNIALCGLQQPIRVRTSADNPSRVTIVSGHRRCAAIQQLIDEGGHDDLRKIPCIRESDSVSPALQELRLIMANSDTRKLTSPEIAQQAQRIEMLLYELKEQGYEFPGRMRDHVAEACQISKSKLARLKVIDSGLKDPEFSRAYRDGELHESTAYELAKLSAADQTLISDTVRAGALTVSRINEFTTLRDNQPKHSCCHNIDDPTAMCDHTQQMQIHRLQAAMYDFNVCSSYGCCFSCPEFESCKQACPHLAEEKAARKEQKRKDAERVKKAREAKERPDVDLVEALWVRFGKARLAAGLSYAEWRKKLGRWYDPNKDAEYMAAENGVAILTPHSELPYGYAADLSAIKQLYQLADLFDCSLDYLLCRTEEDGATPIRWHSGDQTPSKEGDYVVEISLGDDHKIREICNWSMRAWRFSNGSTVDADVIRWFPMPEEVES